MTCSAHRLAATRRFLTEGDVDDLVILARSLPMKSYVVDLGAGTGTTALAVLEHCLGAHVYTVDRDIQALEWVRLNLAGFGIGLDHWIPLAAESSYLAAEWWRDRPIDLLLHDASHKQVDVERDLRAWLPLLKPEAHFWVHDYMPMDDASESYPGVASAIHQLEVEGVIESVGVPLGIGYIGRVRR